MAGGISGVFLVGVFAAVAALCAVLIPRLYRGAGGGQAARPGGDKPEPGGH
jgi:hypothetical protein